MSPGSPARQDGIVITSQAYIASGSAALSPIGNATVGDVGVAITSKRCERLLVLADEQRPHLLRLAVVARRSSPPRARTCRA